MKLFFGILSVMLLFIINCSETKETSSTSTSKITESTQSEFYQYLSKVKLPDKLSFCGESVPLDIEEVHERAEREFYMMLQQPGQIILYIKRAGRYFPMFEKILKQQVAPDDLKYLSVAESALYMARSSKDAVGLWQFMPATAKSMGLIVTESVDERRNPEKSTKAAIKYLKQGYDSQKSWMLAAAGYNMGHENLKDNVSFQNSKDFFELFLNEETSRYILRIAIIKELMENAAKYGIEIPKEDLYKPDNFKTVKVDGAIGSIADWAKDHGTTYKYVKLLNPWILKRELPAPPKGSEWEIAVP